MIMSDCITLCKQNNADSSENRADVDVSVYKKMKILQTFGN